MTYPVYIGDRAAGTMTVTAAGRDTVFELRCPDPEPGLWRAWVQGEEGRLDLGLLEGGRLRRRFSRRLTASLGGVRWAGAEPCGSREPAWRPAGPGDCPPALSPDGAVLPGPDPDHGRPPLGGIPLSGPGPGAPGRKVKFGSTIIRRYVV